MPVIENISTPEMIFAVYVGVPFVSNVPPESSKVVTLILLSVSHLREYVTPR
jgi:hypothetical protein